MNEKLRMCASCGADITGTRAKKYCLSCAAAREKAGHKKYIQGYMNRPPVRAKKRAESTNRQKKTLDNRLDKGMMHAVIDAYCHRENTSRTAIAESIGLQSANMIAYPAVLAVYFYVRYKEAEQT